VKKFWKKTYSMSRYNLSKSDTFGSVFDTSLEILNMQYLIINMVCNQNFKTTYYLRLASFPMIPNTSNINFIFMYLYEIFKNFTTLGVPQKYILLTISGTKAPFVTTSVYLLREYIVSTMWILSWLSVSIGLKTEYVHLKHMGFSQQQQNSTFTHWIAIY